MQKFLCFLVLLFPILKGSSQVYDSVLIKTRLLSLKSSVILSYNPEMMKYLIPLLQNENNKTSELIYECNKYLPFVEKVVNDKRLPHVLTYLPYVITGYINENNPDDGKVGIWNLPYAVARKYDLLMNSYIDERYSAVTSSESAMDYMIDLKHEFGDWRLAILAFCTSPTNVMQHQFKSESKSFEAVYDDLNPGEKRFLDQLTAISYIFNFYREKDIRIQVKPFDTPYSADTVDIYRKLSFDKISLATGIEKSMLRYLNPIYKLEIVPFNEAPHSLIIPKGFKDNFDSLLQNYPNTEAVRPVIDTPVILHDSDIAKIHPPVANNSNKKVPVYYKVKSGDNLYGIADLFDCSAADLKRWNHISRNYLIAGQTLVFYVPSYSKAKYQKMNSLTAKQKKILIYQD